MVNSISHTTLNNGHHMPMLGLGVSGLHGEEAFRIIRHALAVGYRLIDTAAMYDNEAAVGRAVRESGIARSEIFITTKVKNIHQGYDSTLKAFDASLSTIGCDYIDLYLIHWPIRFQRRETWMAMEALYAQGRIRSIGVANYLIPFLDELQDYAAIVPALNQVEFTPYLYRKDLLEYCCDKNIHLQAYSPLAMGRRLDDPKLVAVAAKYNKTPAQIMLRWSLQHGVSAIPKAGNTHRLQENFCVFDFNLLPDDVAWIDHFDENLRLFDDPMKYL